MYNAEDPTCTPRVFTAGQGFVEPETEHILRNEGTVEARWTSANIRPITSPRGSMLLPREPVRSNSRSAGRPVHDRAVAFGCF